MDNIPSIKPGSELVRLRSIAIGPDEELEQTERDKLIAEFLKATPFLEQEPIPELKKYLERYRDILENEEILETIFNKADEKQKQFILHASIILEDEFSEFFLSKLEEGDEDYELASEILLNMPILKLEPKIRKLNSTYYVEELAFILLQRADKEEVVGVVENAVFNPEKLPPLAGKYIEQQQLSRMLLGEYYRDSQLLYLEILDQISPKYDLKKLEEFYKIAHEDGNASNRSKLGTIIIEKYEKEKAHNFFLNIINDEEIPTIDYTEGFTNLKNLKIKRQALWHLVDLLKEEAEENLLKIIKGEDIYLSLEGIRAICDKCNFKNGGEKIVQLIIDEVQTMDRSTPLFILAVTKDPYVQEESFVSGQCRRVQGSQKPFIYSYVEIMKTLLKKIPKILQVLEKAREEQNLKIRLNLSDFFSELNPRKGLIKNLGLENLALFATEPGIENEILRENAIALLNGAKKEELKAFFVKKSEAANRLKKALGITF